MGGVKQQLLQIQAENKNSQPKATNMMKYQKQHLQTR